MKRMFLAAILTPLLALYSCVNDGDRRRVGIDHLFENYVQDYDSGFENDVGSEDIRVRRPVDLSLVPEKDIGPLEEVVDDLGDAKDLGNVNQLCGTDQPLESAVTASIPPHTIDQLSVYPGELIQLEAHHFSQSYFNWPNWQRGGFIAFGILNPEESVLITTRYRPDVIRESFTVPLNQRWMPFNFDEDPEPEMQIMYHSYEPYPNGEANPDDPDDFGKAIFYIGICNP